MNCGTRAAWRFECGGDHVEVTLVRDRDAWRASVDGAAHRLTGVGGNRAGWVWAEVDGAYRDGLVIREGARTTVFVNGDRFFFETPGASREHADGAASDEVKAPLPGTVATIATRAGAAVRKGEPLVTLEAMKMEHQLKAPRDGVVADVAVEEGAQVKEGALLVRLVGEDEAA
jgi:3-methylcrotonyl-CoA carboxylase alpha subunit